MLDSSQIKKIPNKPGVYVMTNKQNGRRYFGHSADLQQRAKRWRYLYKYWRSYGSHYATKYNGKGINNALKEDFRKYSESDWVFEIVVYCTCSQDAWTIERHLIQSERNLYNEIYNDKETGITIDGITKSIIKWCEEYGVSFGSVNKRINRDGLSPKHALEVAVEWQKFYE